MFMIQSTLLVAGYYLNTLSQPHPLASIAFATIKAPSIGMDMVHILPLLVQSLFLVHPVMREEAGWQHGGMTARKCGLEKPFSSDSTVQITFPGHCFFLPRCLHNFVLPFFRTFMSFKIISYKADRIFF